jgi:hypothetical protein
MGFTPDITDDWGNTILPKGTILECQDGVYTGINPQTGTRVQMDASWANDEVYMESFTEVEK